MKHLILILALVTFVTGSYASNVFASSPDVNCVDCLDNENQDIDDQCNDCECHHSHLTDLIYSGFSNYLSIGNLDSLEPIDNLASNSLSSLYRPPIA